MGMVCLLACCCGCSGRPEGAVRLPIVRIDTVGVYGTPRTVQFPGCVRAAQEVNAAFKVGGTLRTIFAEEGEFVRRARRSMLAITGFKPKPPRPSTSASRPKRSA
mgnify:CR=1 FL=1